MYTKYKTEIRSITPKKTVVNNSNNSHITSILDRCRAVNFDGDIAYFCSDLEKGSPELRESVKQLKERQAAVKVQVSAIPEGQTSRLGTVQNRFIVRKKDLLPLIGAKATEIVKAEAAPEFDFEKHENVEQITKTSQIVDPSSIDIEKVQSFTRLAKELTPEEKIKKHINWIVQHQAVEKQKSYQAEGKNLDIGVCRSQVYRQLYTAFDKVLAQILAESGQKLEDVGLGKQEKGYINTVMNKGYIVILQEVARELFNVQ